MRFKNLLTILLLFVATLLWAEPITQSTARKKAVDFASKHGMTIAKDAKNLSTCTVENLNAAISNISPHFPL